MVEVRCERAGEHRTRSLNMTAECRRPVQGRKLNRSATGSVNLFDTGSRGLAYTSAPCSARVSISHLCAPILTVLALFGDSR